MRRRIFLVCFLAIFAAAAAQHPVAVFSQTVPRDPAAQVAGVLEYRGGIVLRSTDPRFGGFSGIHVSTDGGTLLAISDRGAWLRLALRYGGGGRLGGENGQPLTGADAEALARYAAAAARFSLARATRRFRRRASALSLASGVSMR